MAKAKKNSDVYYVLSGYGAAILTLLIHYFIISKLEMSSTVHIGIGLILFFVISGISATLLQKFW